MLKLDFRQLLAFQVIAREKSLSRAAELLHLSQPAISAQLKALEEITGLKLFERGARGMALTSVGSELLVEATKVLDAVDEVMVKARALRHFDLPQEIRLGTISDPSMLKLGELSNLLNEKFPALRLSLTQGISGEIIERVGKSDLDVGFVIGRPEDIRIKFLKVSPITLRVVVPMRWKEVIQHNDWKRIVELPWISTPKDCSYKDIAATMFRRHGEIPKTIVQADQEHALVNLVSHGIGLTLLREDVAVVAEAAKKLIIWPPGIAYDHIYFIYRQNSAGTKITETVLDAVRKLWPI